MDIVTDLTSQCVSFITVAQEAYKQQLPSGKDTGAAFPRLIKEIQTLEVDLAACGPNLRNRVFELVWRSEPDNPAERKESHETEEQYLRRVGDEQKAKDDENLRCFFDTCKDLFFWLDRCRREHQVTMGNLYSSAYEWRAVVREVLYKYFEERIVLVGFLQYMPIQIIFCVGGKDKTAKDQRMLQIWMPDCKLNPLSLKDKETIENWWKEPYQEKILSTEGKKELANGRPRSEIAHDLLGDDHALLQDLLLEENAVPFENLFIDELNEIAKSRGERRHVAGSGEWWNGAADFEEIRDPNLRAKEMNLYGLAFSGGGIRSATFNLGILQKLAELGIMPRFDYLSTVSGGGYIGSWYASWLKRAGSMAKVDDRLNPQKSADPLADEVRPIRWLRMFSNYLAPNASIMSADSWTMGVTWLRNTMINQVLLLFALCVVLSTLGGLFGVWKLEVQYCWVLTDWAMWLISALLLFSGSLFAGAGMHAFSPDTPPKNLKIEKSPSFYYWIYGWGILSAILVSTWMSGHVKDHIDFSAKLALMVVPCDLSFMAFLLVAWIGGYHRCAQPNMGTSSVYFLIILSSLIAALAGAVLIAVAWDLLAAIHGIVAPKHDNASLFKYFSYKLAFVLGVPLILEVMSITVVVRMAILGVLFPDLRREWWGRIGAIAHRFMALWILVTFCTLLLPDYFRLLASGVTRQTFTAIFGSWTAIIGSAVKMAYSSGSPAGDAKKTSLSFSELFIRFAPYLFALGFILFGSIILNYMYRIFGVTVDKTNYWYIHLLTALVLGLITWGLSSRTGVNEFSLHHFYRNRLTRAYLGATLRRESRERSVNTFTNFDQEDDLLLMELTTDKHYFGPYPLINTTLNATVVTDLDRQDRKGESFVFTPKYCGFDVSRTRPSANSRTNVFEYAYRPTAGFAYAQGPSLGTAFTISGAAVSPNMGYHSSPATAFLLTIFNVRLGWWIGNPRTDKWRRSDPKTGIFYLLDDLIGKSDITSDYVCLSDGGHFDNMGIYELVRRKCRYILLCDAEEDEQTTCEGLANAIRRCRIDFGVEIKLDLVPITKKDKDTGFCESHTVKGTIWYPGDDQSPSGTLIYVKTSLTGKETVDIREYFLDNLAFPQQSTGDQFFDESQFESYRQLGYQSISKAKDLRK